MTMSLVDRKCTPCEGGMAPLTPEEIAPLFQKLESSWQLVENRRLEKEYKFKNFRRALEFVNHVGEIAEREGHHPDIFLSWGKVRLCIWTHVAGGLTENHFILDVKSDRAFEEMLRRAIS